MNTEASKKGYSQVDLQYAKQQMGMRYEMNSDLSNGKGRNTFAHTPQRSWNRHQASDYGTAMCGFPVDSVDLARR